MENKAYQQLAVTLIFSYLLMYAIMFLNVNEPGHIYLNLTRAYMTLLMIAAMAVLMVLRMPAMYSNKRRNQWIIGSSLLVFTLALIGVHRQTCIGDIQYMKGMIPHHSIAIMTSQNAHIHDPRVRKLADGIIRTQVREIGEMKALIDSLQKAGQ